jgi:hypothetical protein
MHLARFVMKPRWKSIFVCLLPQSSAYISCRTQPLRFNFSLVLVPSLSWQIDAFRCESCWKRSNIERKAFVLFSPYRRPAVTVALPPVRPRAEQHLKRVSRPPRPCTEHISFYSQRFLYPSRACLGKMIVFSIYKTAQKSRFAPTADAISACEKRAFFEFSLCLSRACLGKKMILNK